MLNQYFFLLTSERIHDLLEWNEGEDDKALVQYFSVSETFRSILNQRGMIYVPNTDAPLSGIHHTDSGTLVELEGLDIEWIKKVAEEVTAAYDDEDEVVKAVKFQLI